jgi:hypothetical protein
MSLVQFSAYPKKGKCLRWTCGRTQRILMWRWSSQSKGTHQSERELQVPPSTIPCHALFLTPHITLLTCLDLDGICMAASCRPYLVRTDRGQDANKQRPRVRSFERWHDANTHRYERKDACPNGLNSIGSSQCCWWSKSATISLHCPSMHHFWRCVNPQISHSHG